MDLTFKTEHGRFNYRVGAIIIRDNHLLMVKNEKAPYYYSVGGRVKFGESSEAAVLREIKEELGVDATIERAVFLNESFFTEQISGEDFHEVSMYYLVNLPETEKDFECLSITENGAKESLHWLDIASLKKVQAYPEFLASELPNLPTSLKYLVERQG